MTAEILDFEAHRKIWKTAYAECQACRCEWVDVYPKKRDTVLECPNCGAQDCMTHE